MALKIRFHPYQLPLKFNWPGIHGSIPRQRQGWIIEVCFNGKKAYGECAPWPDIGCEPMSLASGALDALAGMEFVSPAPLWRHLNSLQNAHPAVYCGIETALLDLAAQNQEKPLRYLLHPQAVDSIRCNDFGGALCPASSLPDSRLIKFKVGLLPLAEELTCLSRLCRKLPANSRIRLDANGRWNIDQAFDFLQQLQGLPIEALEEPAANITLEEWAELQNSTSIRLAMDESITRFPITRLLDCREIQRLVLKPMAQGGLRRCIELAGMFSRAGKQVIITSSMESAIGIWATAQLTAAVEGITRENLYHGLATSDWLAENLAQPPKINHQSLILSTQPGLGVSL